MGSSGSKSPKLDLAAFPDNILLQIVQCLPFDQKVRIGRVNKRFNRISQVAMATTKWASFTDSQLMLKNLDKDSFLSLLGIYAANLERMTFGDELISDSMDQKKFEWIRHPPFRDMFKRFETMGEFSPLGLVLFLTIAQPLIASKEVFEAIVRNCPRLRSFKWYGLSTPAFPNLVCDSLNELEIANCSGDLLRSLAGKLPNLHRFGANLFFVLKEDTEEFFRSMKKLNALSLNFKQCEFNLRDLQQFWELSDLTSLRISGAEQIQDDELGMVAGVFGNLRVLQLETCDGGGVAALASLRELRALNLVFSWTDDPSDLNCGFQQLAGCSRLQRVEFRNRYVNPTTLISLIHSCPELGVVAFMNMTEVDTSVMAAAMLRSLFGIGPRKIDIVMQCQPSLDAGSETAFGRIGNAVKWSRVWRSKVVRTTLKKLKQDDGAEVSIICGETEWKGH